MAIELRNGHGAAFLENFIVIMKNNTHVTCVFFRNIKYDSYEEIIPPLIKSEF